MSEQPSRANGASPEYSEMGGRLREARQRRGLSLRDLAERLGVSPSLISQVETGRAKPSVSTLYAIASELEISLDELLFPDAAPRASAAVAARGVEEAAAVAAAAAAGVGAGAPGVAPVGGVTAGGAGAGGGAVASPVSPPAETAPTNYQPVQPAATRKKIRLASGVVWERLTSVSMPNVDFFYVTYEVGGASSPEHEFQRHPGQEWGYIVSGRLHVTIGFDEYELKAGDAISFDSTTPHRLANLSDEPVHGVWFIMGRRPVEITPGER